MADQPKGSRLATAWFALALFTTLPFVWLLGALVLLVTRPFDPKRHAMVRVVHFCCHQYARCWPLWRVRFTGRAHLPKGPCVLIANHQSMADVLVLMGLGVPFIFVSKAEMFDVPFIGWMMGWMRHISLRRDRRVSMKQMLQTCALRLNDGEAVMIFPEGTYAAGPSRLPFRRGPFHLAQHCQVPVVPLVIRGAKELVFESGPLWSLRGEVHVEIMPPIAPPAPHELLGPFVAEVQRSYTGWLGQPFAHSERRGRLEDGQEPEPGVG